MRGASRNDGPGLRYALGLDSPNCTRARGRGGRPRHGEAMSLTPGGPGGRAARPCRGGEGVHAQVSDLGLKPQVGFGPTCLLGTAGPCGRHRRSEVGFAQGFHPQARGRAFVGKPRRRRGRSCPARAGSRVVIPRVVIRCAGAVEPLMTKGPGTKPRNAVPVSPSRCTSFPASAS